MRRENALLRVVLRGDHRGTRAVAEDHADVASARREIDARRMDLATHEENSPRFAGADVLIRDRETVEESGTLVLHVERRHAGDPEPLLQDAGARREVVVRR